MRPLAIALLLTSLALLAGEPRITALVDGGARVDWSAATGLIAVDIQGRDGLCDIHIMRADGSRRRCLSCATPGLPANHVGQPAWHPGGDWLVVQAENPALPGFRASATLHSYLESPGIGINNDLWLLAADGSRAIQVTQIRDRLGVLHPHFSPDGGHLTWAEALRWRPGRGHQWALRLAPVTLIDGTPQVGQARTFLPGRLALYETHGFSPDGTRIIYSASPGPTDYFGLDIYTCDLEGGAVERLTEDREWDEHAHFSPDGRHVVWMSSRDIPQPPAARRLLTDLWLMCPDGSGKRRLTRFNDPDSPHAIPGGVVCSDSSWSPDGRSLVFFVILQKDAATRPRGVASTRVYRLDMPE